MQLGLDSLEHLATGFDQLHGLPIKRPLGSRVSLALPLGLSAAFQSLKRDRSGVTRAMEAALFQGHSKDMS